MHKVTLNSSISGSVYDKVNLTGRQFLQYTHHLVLVIQLLQITGNFRISNMRVGGPYKITISFVGFSNFEDSDVYLQLGETKLLKLFYLKSQIN
jgi:hypothetical protein